MVETLPNLRRTDVRFVLPRPVERACVLGDLPEWREGLAQAGVTVVPAHAAHRDDKTSPDLAVAPQRLAADAAATGAHAVVLDRGLDARALHRAGYTLQRHLALPDREHPEVLLPLGHRAVARYLFRQARPAETRVKGARNRVLVALAALDALPEPGRVQVVGVRRPGPPFLLQAAAAAHGIAPNATWYLALGGGDRLSRAVFHVVPPGGREPEHVVKFARVPGHTAPFDREESALALVARAGPLVSAHAPHLLGRLEIAGLHASVETAATGRTLAVRLRTGSRAHGLRLVEDVAAWIVAVGRDTAAPPQALGPELERLRQHVLPAWQERGADPGLLATLPPLPATLQHNDLGTWNIVAGDHGFVALDWESAREHGLPLWDLLYFLVDALPRLDGAWAPEERADHAVRLLRGEHPRSALLFQWLRRGVEASAVPPAAVGTVATLCWLSHGLSHVRRRDAVDRHAPGTPASVPPIERLAPVWLRDPLLGPGWDRWRA